MNRRLSIAFALVAAGSLGVSLTSCNTPSCGPGTVQQQQKDGQLKCVPVDVQETGIPCDVDAGNVVIVGGKCVSAVQCDPGTTVDVNGVCVGTGGTAKCSTPTAGKACIDGAILNFKTNAKGADPIDVLLFDPVTLLSGGAPLTSCTSDGANYVCQNFTPPGLGLVAIVTGGKTAGFVPAGSAGQGISASKYTIDTYEVKKSDADAWGFDYTTGGAFIAKFYSDPKPTGSIIQASADTHAVSGVTLTKDGAAAAGAKYFDDTLTTVSGTMTTTGASGVAIVASPIPTGGNFPIFSGMGGMNPGGMPITWEQLPGGSTMGFVLILRFHPM
jgi:hypothetical protein